jgi:sulfur carrier protein
MRVLINGQPHEYSDAALTVTELLARLELAGKRIAVEMNGDVVPRSRHAQTVVRDGDSFEIIVAVGGG